MGFLPLGLQTRQYRFSIIRKHAVDLIDEKVYRMNTSREGNRPKCFDARAFSSTSKLSATESKHLKVGVGHFSRNSLMRNFLASNGMLFGNSHPIELYSILGLEFAVRKCSDVKLLSDNLPNVCQIVRSYSRDSVRRERCFRVRQLRASVR